MIPKAMVQLYAACILISSLSISVGTMDAEGNAEISSGGSGTLLDPYLIEDVNELQAINNNLGSHYKLKNDISAAPTSTWNSGAGFLPIGTLAYKFTGSLNGDNRTISGLFINRPGTDYVGLFGNVDSVASLKNIGIISSNITGHNYVGGLAGYCSGPVSYSHFGGDVRGNQYSGGLVGYSSSTVTNCYTTGKVIGSAADTGGLVGQNGGTLSNCHSLANVSGTLFTGGLAGYSNSAVSNCYSTGIVGGTGSNTGGLLGYHEKAVVSVSYAKGKVTGSGDYVGGLAGYISDCTVSSSYATGTIGGTGKYVGGLVGYNSDGIIFSSYETGTVSGSDKYVGGLVGYSSDKGSVSFASAIGAVTATGLSSGGLIGQNYGTVSNCSAAGDLSGTGLVGGLIGQNYGAVSNCSAIGKVTGTADNAGGLMGLNNGNVEYCLSTGRVAGTQYVGGLVGDNGGTVSHSHSTGKASGYNNIGGLGGRNGGAVSYSYSTGDASGNTIIGGLIGTNTGSVSRSYSTGNMTGNNNIGGLVSINSGGVVSNSYYNVDKVQINGDEHLTMWGLYDLQYQDWFDNGFSLDISDYSTSLVPSGDHYLISTVQGLRDLNGFAEVPTYKFRLASDIDLSGTPGLYIPYFAGAEFDGSNHRISNINIDIPFSSYTGMFGYYEGGDIRNIVIVDANVSGYRYAGGLAGYIKNGVVSNCYAAGSVSGASDYIGGLAGYMNGNTVMNSHTSGKVSGAEGVGGLVGTNDHGTVSKCFSITSVSGGTKVGGLVGENNYGNVEASFWDKQTSGKATSSGGTGLTTAEMKTKKTFTNAGWDFTNIWAILEKVTYPFFRWEDTQFPIANAGPDRTVNEGDTVAFDGSGSSDNMGITIYAWKFTDGITIALDGPRPSYKFNTPGEYVVTLNVTDGADQLSGDTIVITVLDILSPSADAGPDQIVVEGSFVTFDGSGSSDSGGIANYTWRFNDGGIVTLYGSNPRYRFDIPGEYIVTMNVTDPADRWKVDTVVVTVKDITLPVANASIDQVVDVGTIVLFDGSASSDNGEVRNWTWTFWDQALITLYGAQPTYQFKRPGLFVVALKVLDAARNSHNDTMNVTVSDMTPPVAEAGPDQVVNEGTIVDFDGSGSSDNHRIVLYTWRFQYGLDKKVLKGIEPVFTFKIPGIYSVELKVFDEANRSDEDTMTVTVNDISPPVVNAGSDQTVTVGKTLVLDGSLSTDNGQIKDYTWTFTYDGEEQVLSGKEVSFTFTKGGVYDILLTVTDQSGNSKNDSVRIIVIDTGLVKGTVLDKDGMPVGGATVTITASDGKTYTGTTKDDGSFSIEVYYGSFTYEISKSGFTTISGSSTVNATGMKELDLAGSPLLVSEKNGSSGMIIIIAAVVVVLIVIGVIVFILMRRKKAPAEQVVEEAPQEYEPLPTEQVPPPEIPLQEDFMADAPPIEDNPEIPPDPLAEKISLQTMDTASFDTADPPPVPYQETVDVPVEAPSEPAAPAPATPESTDTATPP
jgi:hypothetical protein